MVYTSYYCICYTYWVVIYIYTYIHIYLYTYYIYIYHINTISYKHIGITNIAIIALTRLPGSSQVVWIHQVIRTRKIPQPRSSDGSSIAAKSPTKWQIHKAQHHRSILRVRPVSSVKSPGYQRGFGIQNPRNHRESSLWFPRRWECTIHHFYPFIHL